MEATGCATAAAICTCAPVQNRCGVHPNPKTKSNTNTMCLQNTLGEDPGSGHFYLAENRTFLLCVDTNRSGDCSCKAGASPSLRLLQLITNEGGTSKLIK